MTRTLDGTLNYLSANAVELVTAEGPFLLAIDRPPMGVFDGNDVQTAASFMSMVLGKGQDAPATILGIPFQPIPTRNVLGIIRVLA